MAGGIMPCMEATLNGARVSLDSSRVTLRTTMLWAGTTPTKAQVTFTAALPTGQPIPGPAEGAVLVLGKLRLLGTVEAADDGSVRTFTGQAAVPIHTR